MSDELDGELKPTSIEMSAVSQTSYGAGSSEQNRPSVNYHRVPLRDEDDLMQEEEGSAESALVGVGESARDSTRDTGICSRIPVAIRLLLLVALLFFVSTY
jgi:hypothetical protein